MSHQRGPSTMKPKMQEKETTNLQAILSAPITCTIPLIELLKLKLELWEGLTERLVEQGVLNKGQFDQEEPAITIWREPIELNKVSGITAKDGGNTTLPVNYEELSPLPFWIVEQA